MFARQRFAAWLSAMAGELIPVNDLDPPVQFDVQPLLAPMIDLYLIYAFVFLDVRAALIAWGVFIALQMLSACVALRLDGESLRTVWALPITQFYCRQLLYLVVLQSVASAISGSRLR
jgi:hypothetical protein